VITLQLADRSARFVSGEQPITPSLALGPVLLREQVLRHAPPTPLELEAAIEYVEDILMPLYRGWPVAPELRVRADGELFDAMALEHDRVLGRDGVEDLFARAAAISQGRPQASDPQFARPEVVGLLVVVREAMHHLGFETVRFSR
jgi:hypothetical protein